MVYAIPQFELLDYVSLPCFNDVHHVRPSPSGNIALANAGLKMVLEMTSEGEIIRAWNALGEDPWAHVDPEVDYRKVSTKPHQAHPNYIFYLGSELWATRFHQGDAISLEGVGSLNSAERRARPRRAAPRRKALLHDRRRYDRGRRRRAARSDREDRPGGLLRRTDAARLRALVVLVDDVSRALGLVFGRDHPTQFRENVDWVARGFRRGKPTHLACYDLKQANLPYRDRSRAGGPRRAVQRLPGSCRLAVSRSDRRRTGCHGGSSRPLCSSPRPPTAYVR